MEDYFKKRKKLIIAGISLVILIITNPTPSNFDNYLNANKIVPTYNGRVGYFFFFSIYKATYHTEYYEENVTYLGIAKNFIEISNDERRTKGRRQFE